MKLPKLKKKNIKEKVVNEIVIVTNKFLKMIIFLLLIYIIVPADHYNCFLTDTQIFIDYNFNLKA